MANKNLFHKKYLNVGSPRASFSTLGYDIRGSRVDRGIRYSEASFQSDFPFCTNAIALHRAYSDHMGLICLLEYQGI